MKVLHLSTRDSGSGAYIACERLHRTLLANNVDSWILCEIPSGLVPNVIGMRKGNGRGSFRERLRGRFFSEIGRLKNPPFFKEPSCHSTFSMNFQKNKIIKMIESIEPDVIHLHWVGSGFLRIEDLSLIASVFPVVWTLHDMWPFCGAEHYSYDDTRWVNGYTALNRDKASRGPDFNRWVWQRKVKAWTGLTIHTIAVSQWTNDCVKRSRLFNGINGFRRVIHNGLDETTFSPLHSSGECELRRRRERRSWRIAFGAIRQDVPIKGGDLLIEALSYVVDSIENVELYTFGSGGIQTIEKVKIYNRGRVVSPSDLASLYSSVDIVVVPSRLETFGQVAAEALACGTPVVCFDTSGLRDIVNHRINGYLAQCYDPSDLAKGICWCLENEDRYEFLSLNARETVIERFCISKIANKINELYEEILKIN